MSQEGETTAAMANMEIAADDVEDSAKKGFFKRDALRANETAVQKKWADAKVFESNPESDKESFMVTFPYPVLFPFAFHCTGMPIQAVRIL
jgi:leucyl-tRNA synthetase